MQRRIWLTCFVSSLALALVPHAVRADAVFPPEPEVAEIVAIDTSAEVIVFRIAGRERRGRYDRFTRVRVRRAPGAITDLRPGMRVRVRFATLEGGRRSSRLVSIDA